MAGDRDRVRRKVGRVEAGLEHALVDRPDIGPAQRSHLRSQAHAVDLAEAALDSDRITTANHGYLVSLTAAGLTAGGAKPVDAFDELLARISAPSASDAQDT